MAKRIIQEKNWNLKTED